MVCGYHYLQPTWNTWAEIIDASQQLVLAAMWKMRWDNFSGGLFSWMVALLWKLWNLIPVKLHISASTIAWSICGCYLEYFLHSWPVLSFFSLRDRQSSPNIMFKHVKRIFARSVYDNCYGGKLGGECLAHKRLSFLITRASRTAHVWLEMALHTHP